MKITIEAETPNDSGSLFRVAIDGRIVGETLTAVQAHIVVGEILEKVALPAKGKQAPQIFRENANGV